MYLGIDLGTSQIKAVIMDGDQAILAQASCALTLSRPQPLWSEQNPEDWWQATNNAISQLKQSHPQYLADIKAIGLSGQQHGATLLDKNDQVLRPAILWNDGRSLTQCHELQSRVKNYAKITGNQIMPGFTAPKLLWVMQNEPAIFKQVNKILLPKDYLRLKMTGDYASDLSDASGTSWLNVGARSWSDEMLNATHLSQKQMPALFEGTEITGTVLKSIADAWGIPENTPVAAGAGDNAAGAISVNVIKPGVAFLSLGTSGVYFLSCDEFKPNPAGGVHTFCHCLPKLWHQMTVHLSAASCLSWLAEITNSSPQILLQEAQSQLEQDESVIFLPYLSGERTPHNNPYARGVFFGLSHNTKRADLTRAVLEGVAMAFADGQDEILKTGMQIDQVFVVGGGARSTYWGQILACALNRPLIYQVNREVGAAYGAARLALLAIQKLDAARVFTTPAIDTIIEPMAEYTEKLAQKRKTFSGIYQQLKELYRAHTETKK